MVEDHSATENSCFFNRKIVFGTKVVICEER